MFRKALDIAIHEEGVIDKNLLKFSTSSTNKSFLTFYKTLDDYSIYQKIIENEKSKSSKEILTSIQKRNLLKRACDFTPDALNKNEDVATQLMKKTQEELDDIATNIAESLHLKPHEVIFYKSSIDMKLYKRGEILIKRRNETRDLNNVSPITIKDLNVIRYYIFGPADKLTRKSIAKKAASELGLEPASISYLEPN